MLKDTKESCGSGLNYIRWQCAIFTLFISFLFCPHCDFPICKWMKWPNFTKLYCVWMSRCNLTKCCSESWLYGLYFQTTDYFDFVCIACVCVCVCVFTCVPACSHTYLLVTVHAFTLKLYCCILFAQSTKSWRPLLIFLRLSCSGTDT